MSAIPVALAAASGLAKAKVKEAKVSARFGLATSLALAASAVFFIAGITIALSEQIGSIYACLVMGAVFMVIGIVLMMVRAQKAKRLKRSANVDTALLKAAVSGSNFGLLLPLGALIAGASLASSDRSSDD